MISATPLRQPPSKTLQLLSLPFGTVPERKLLDSSESPPLSTVTIALVIRYLPRLHAGSGYPPFLSDGESGEEAVALEDAKNMGSNSLPVSTPPLATRFRDIQPVLKIHIQPYNGHFVGAESLVTVSSRQYEAEGTLTYRISDGCSYRCCLCGIYTAYALPYSSLPSFPHSTMIILSGAASEIRTY